MPGKTTRRAFAICCVLCVSAVSPIFADEIHLENGSLLVGEIRSMDKDFLVVETAFAGTVSIERAMITGLGTDQPMSVVLATGERRTALLAYDPEAGQRLLSEEGEAIILPPEDIQSLAGRETQKETTAQAQGETAPPARPAAPPASAQQKKERKVTWTGRIEGGISGAAGNSDRFAFQGRGDAKRETDVNRLAVYLEGHIASEDGAQTQNEVLGGARFERDFTDRLHGFAALDGERDRFESLDLRTVLSAGAGYFLIREDNQIWKARGGFGWRQEFFEDGTSQSEGVLTLGYDYEITLKQWLNFTHRFDYLPALSDLGSDFRIESDARFHLPVSDSKKWSVSVGVRNQYDNETQPGTKKLDTTYSVNFGRTFD